MKFMNLLLTLWITSLVSFIAYLFYSVSADEKTSKNITILFHIALCLGYVCLLFWIILSPVFYKGI